MALPKRALIAGGTGFIGLQIQRKLIDNGWRTIIITRRKRRFADQSRVMDLRDLQSAGIPEVDAVINVAGLNILNPFRRWNDQFIEDLTMSRVNLSYLLTSNIAAMQNKPKAHIAISGVAVYPTNDPRVEFTEERTPPPFDWLSKFTKEWELGNTIHEDTGVRNVIVRSGVVLGRHGGMIQQLYLPFLFGLGGPIGSGKQYLPWIHLDDIVGIFYHALINENVRGILNGVAPQVVTNKEFSDAFAKAMHRPAFIPVPSLAMKVLYGNVRAKMILEGQRVIPKRTLESGYEYLFPDINSACENLVSKKK